MRLLWTVLALAVALAGSGCAKRAPDPTARAFYEAVRTGDLAKVRSLAAPELRTAQADIQLLRLTVVLPKEPPTASDVLSRSVSSSEGGGETVETREVYDVASRKVVVDARLRRAAAGEPWRVAAFHVSVLSAQDLTANTFTLRDKTPIHYVFLAGGVASLMLMLAAVVKVLRQEGLRWRWAWALFALVGGVTLQMNWATGEVTINWFTLQLIGAGAVTSLPGLTPWILTFTLPIGAMLILGGEWAKADRTPAGD
ncbi:hypothetical protein [Phenylobacterium sp.]|uniref:hypothetical protein n=1 Tax=Phenylobacterium sp. TaxID=1871053 RepID=UPI0025CBC94B|nr:hypothetical protein [Phenylobacterium sp.]